MHPIVHSCILQQTVLYTYLVRFLKLIFGLVLVNATVDAECTSGSVNFALATGFAERFISNLLINF